MSQKKVDTYKAGKKQHNKAARKEKMLFGLEMFAWAFICVVIVAWIGYSAYVKITGTKENVVQNTVMDTTALDSYISNLSAEDEEDSTDADTADGEDTTDADTADEEDTTASADADGEDADAKETSDDTDSEDKDTTDDSADDAETDTTDSADAE